MKPRRLFLALVAGCMAISASISHAATEAVPGELIVKYRPGVSESRRAAIEAAIPGLRRVGRLGLIGAEHFRVSGISAEETIARLVRDPDVAYAEPNYYVYAQEAQVVPNDPSFNQLWGMLNTGQGGGYAGCDIKATLAWDIDTGDPNFKIGVIDTGIDYTHPDLAANVWTNPGEIAGNGKDDDKNGYVDDVHGYDFVNHDGDPMDDGYHGTHVAGTIGAVGNNAVGVTGVNWQCAMVAIKFMNATGVGTEADAISAIGYSVAVGCRLTNNSWGNMSGGQAMLDAIHAAGAAGQLMIFAAGNNGWNIDTVPFWPPSYLAPNMINVTSTDGRDLRPTLTNYGLVTVHLGAPGLNIDSCKPGNQYQFLTGTSMACPHVAGAAALAMGRYPLASIGVIRQLILDNVDPIASMSGVTVTGGRLNAYKTLWNIPAIAPTPAAVTVYVAPGWIRDTTLTVSNTGRGPLAFKLPTPAPTAWLSASPDTGNVAAGSGSAVVLHVDATGLLDGTYNATLPITSNDPVTPSTSASVQLVVNTLTGVGDAPGVAFRFRSLSRAPSSGVVALELSLPRGGPADVSVFDVRGRRVARLVSGLVGPGVHALHWNGDDGRGVPVGSGIYFARARTRDGEASLRVVLLE